MKRILTVLTMVFLLATAACMPSPTRTPTPPPTFTPTFTLTATRIPPTFTPRPTATFTPVPPTLTPYIDRTPPRITGLEWQPTKVVNSKVYDGMIVFEAEDDSSGIAYAELNFIPKEYPHLSKAAFPEEDTSKFVLKPLDGAFNGLREQFAANITDILGGREYEVEAIVKDEAGNISTAKLKTPYVREFENIGKLLYEKGIIVSAVYLPWNFKDIPMKDGDIPLLGRYYDTLDDIVQWKQIDWFSGHGGNVFYLDLQSHWWPEIRYRVMNVLHDILDKGGVKVAMLYRGDWSRHFRMGEYGAEIPEWAVDLSDDYNLNIFLSFMDKILIDNILNNTNYHKINGRPVLYIWDERALFNQERAYSELKEKYDLFIIADWFPRIPTLPDESYIQAELQNYRGIGLELVDSYTGWIGFHPVGMDTKKYVDDYSFYYERSLKAYRSFTESQGKIFIATITPGFDNSYSWGGPQIPLPRSPEFFKERLRIALKYLDEKHKEIKIDTWNDFGEWSYIEPSQSEGFAYLQVLKQTLLEY